MSWIPSANVAVYELRAGIAAGFLELEQNITYGRQAEALVDKLGRIKRFQSRHVAMRERTSRLQAATIFRASP
jgi:hypothetical protein